MTERTPGRDAELRTALETHLGELGRKGVVFKDVVLAANTAKTIPHGLGTVPQGWLAYRIRAAAAADYPREARVPTKNEIAIIAGVAMTVNVMVW